MPQFYSENSSFKTRALQTWIILVGRARNRQTITYEMLSEQLNYGSNHIGGILDHVYDYCRLNNLPPLTILVVGKHSGVPGSGMGEVSFSDFEKVYEYDWYNVIPPSIEELDAAYKARK